MHIHGLRLNIQSVSQVVEVRDCRCFDVLIGTLSLQWAHKSSERPQM